MNTVPTGETKKKLTVIVPIRCSADRHDAIDRLSFLSHDTMCPEAVEFLVVDDGSPAPLSEEIEAKCLSSGLRYFRIDSELDIFSIGRARNVGAQQASGQFVMFQDVDLMVYPGFYLQVLNEIEVQGLTNFAERFLMFGVIYLSREASLEYLQTPPLLRRQKFIQYLLDADDKRIEKFSTGTSVTVWRRAYFLATGGNDPDFVGWGYEDIEYTCRAIRRVRKFPLPEEFSLDYKNFQTISEYRGWKSIYRLFGDMTFQKGLVLFHAWHPVEHDGLYIRLRERNRLLFEKKLKAFKDECVEPPPLSMPERGRSIIFKNNPWVNNRWLSPMLGEVVLLDEEMFTPESLLNFISERNISRVVFHNPYSSERMLGIYRAIKAASIEYLVCERGALPGSVFIDPCGFNGESKSYHPSKWDRELSCSELDSVKEYIKEYKLFGSSLERQPERLGARELREKLNISLGSKILFVPLQRPSDTVIQYLSGPIGDYERFLSLVRRLVHCLPADWVIVAKRHPLEVQDPDLPGVMFANDFHINDLVEASNALLLINSGVGVIGLMYEKPVFYAGTAFYGHEGLAMQVTDHESLLSSLNNFRPDKEKVTRFLSYLVNEFYSFAEFKTRTVKWGEALMTATVAIDYHVLRVPGCPEFRMERRKDVAVRESSIIFDRYRRPDGAIYRKSFDKSSPAKPVNRIDGVNSVKALNITSGGVKDKRRPRVVRKMLKLWRNPVMFLRDSRFSLLKRVGWAIKKI